MLRNTRNLSHIYPRCVIEGEQQRNHNRNKRLGNLLDSILYVSLAAFVGLAIYLQCNGGFIN